MPVIPGIDISTALLKLRPRAEFAISDNDYNQIDWFDTEQTLPSEEEVMAKVEELKAGYAMKILREARDYRLSRCDWVGVTDIQLPQEKLDEWKAYRQALRDITTTANPDYDENGRLINVTWPVPPS